MKTYSELEEWTEFVLTHYDKRKDREALKRTPERVKQSFDYILGGYEEDAAKGLKSATFKANGYDEMVVVTNIEFYSLCEHHLLPFFGRAHLAYLPKGRVVGLSKLARLVDVYSRRLQIQEALTEQIARAMMNALDALGTGVVIEAEHLCMKMRGVKKQNSIMKTSSLCGAFRDATVRAEFLELIRD